MLLNDQMSRALFFANAVRAYDQAKTPTEKIAALPAGMNQRDWAATLKLFRPALAAATDATYLNRKLT